MDCIAHHTNNIKPNLVFQSVLLFFITVQNYYFALPMHINNNNNFVHIVIYVGKKVYINYCYKSNSYKESFTFH